MLEAVGVGIWTANYKKLVSPSFPPTIKSKIMELHWRYVYNLLYESIDEILFKIDKKLDLENIELTEQEQEELDIKIKALVDFVKKMYESKIN